MDEQNFNEIVRKYLSKSIIPAAMTTVLLYIVSIIEEFALFGKIDVIPTAIISLTFFPSFLYLCIRICYNKDKRKK